MKNLRSKFLRLFAWTLAMAIALFAAGVAMPLVQYRLAANDTRPLVFDNVSIIDVESGQARGASTIVIADNLILYAGPAAGAPVPAGTRRINGTGMYAMPGLWDMHVHTTGLSPQLHFPLLIANGVTTIRDMGDGCSFGGDLACRPDGPRWESETKAGQLLAPRIIAAASYHVEEVEPGVVDRLRARGDGMLKLQLPDDVNPAVFTALVSDGRKAGMQVAGHLPHSVDLLAQPAAGLHSIEHDSSLLPQCSAQHTTFDGRTGSKLPLLLRADAKRCAAVLALMAAHGIGYVPSHIASSGQDVSLLSGAYTEDPHLRYVAWPQRILWRAYAGTHVAGTSEQDRAPLQAWHAEALKLTAQAQRAGVAVMAGSDAIDAYITHGFSLHDELEQLVRAGLSPADALRAATIVPARHAGLHHHSGSISEGKRADIVLLSKNPLLSITHTRAIESVVLDGRLHERTQLDGMLQFVSAQASTLSMNCKFLWAMIRPS